MERRRRNHTMHEDVCEARPSEPSGQTELQSRYKAESCRVLLMLRGTLYLSSLLGHGFEPVSGMDACMPTLFLACITDTDVV